MTVNYTSKTLTILQLRERLAELEEKYKFGEPDENADQDVWAEWEELEMLRSVASSLSWCWGRDNETLINTEHFDEFAEELCYEVGDCQKGGLVARVVDWGKVSELVVQDYKKVILDGNDFYIRA